MKKRKNDKKSFLAFSLLLRTCSIDSGLALRTVPHRSKSFLVHHALVALTTVTDDVIIYHDNSLRIFVVVGVSGSNPYNTQAFPLKV